MPSNVWYYSWGSCVFGPVSRNELRQLAARGKIPGDARLWPEGVDPAQSATAADVLDLILDPVVPPAPAPDWLDDVRRVADDVRRRQVKPSIPHTTWLEDVSRRETRQEKPAPLAPGPPPAPRRRGKWPLSQDYNEAIQNPTLCFRDPELAQGTVKVSTLGIPLPCSGNFADVYEIIRPNGAGSLAVKCFTREVPGLRDRYAAISDHLKTVSLPYTVDFTYLEDGIQVRGLWYPVLKMQWVQGQTLNAFVKDHADHPAVLGVLARLWHWMSVRLRGADIAHCDLQHGNVLLVPENSAEALSLRLIDYDGSWVPALAKVKPGELGHHAYQHPQRLKEGVYSPKIDHFSNLVIFTAIRGITIGGRALWDRYDNGDNMLFRREDLAAPQDSKLFAELRASPDAQTRRLAECLAAAAQQPLDQLRPLDEVTGEV
jgi:hypothetical protein